MPVTDASIDTRSLRPTTLAEAAPGAFFVGADRKARIIGFVPEVGGGKIRLAIELDTWGIIRPDSSDAPEVSGTSVADPWWEAVPSTGGQVDEALPGDLIVGPNGPIGIVGILAKAKGKAALMFEAGPATDRRIAYMLWSIGATDGGKRKTLFTRVDV